MSSKQSKSTKPAAKSTRPAKGKTKQVAPIAAAPFGHDLGEAPQVTAVVASATPSDTAVSDADTRVTQPDKVKKAKGKSAKNDREAFKKDLEALAKQADAAVAEIRSNLQARILRPVGDNPNPVAAKFKDIAVGTAFAFAAAPDLAVYLKVGNTSFLRSEQSAYTKGQVLATKGRTKPGCKVFPLKSTLSVDTIPVADNSRD